MSEDQTRRGAAAESSAPDPWLRHETDHASSDHATAGDPQDGHEDDDPWLRHDVSDPTPTPALGEQVTSRHAEESRTSRRRGTGRRRGAAAVLGAAGREFVIVVGMALILSFVVKTWLLQAFYIPSGSMEDTLVLNDRVIVSKLTPGPFELHRGDIVVFADPGNWLETVPEAKHSSAVTAIRKTLMFVGLLPDDAENHLIKRVIGLPGDRVACCDEGERLTVNGVPLNEPYLKPGNAPSSQDFDIRVPAGSVWVMGDHRSDSSDSRFHDPSGTGSDGSVPESLIVGRAVALVWPLDHLTWLSNPTSTFAKVPSPSPSAGSGRG